MARIGLKVSSIPPLKLEGCAGKTFFIIMQGTRVRPPSSCPMIAKSGTAAAAACRMAGWNDSTVKLLICQESGGGGGGVTF